MEHSVVFDLKKTFFEHVTKPNDDKDDDMCMNRTTNVWENLNIIGDVLIQALYHPTFTFPIFNHNFCTLPA